MKTVSLLILACLTGLSISASAQVPELINYQGRLVDGTNLVNGDVSLELKLYDTVTDGTLLYVDSNTVTVVDGLYATYLGDQTVMGSLTNALTNAMVYLEIVVNGSALSPRERLVAVPYAIKSNRLTGGSLNQAGDRLYISDDIFVEKMPDGTVQLCNSWSREVVEPWEHPIGLMDSVSIGESRGVSPKAAIASNGYAIVVWYQWVDVMDQVFACDRTDAGYWKLPHDLSTDSLSFIVPGGGHPQLAMGGAGIAITVWEKRSSIYKAEHNGSFWTRPNTNFNPNGSPAARPQVAMDNDGDAIIVWEQSDGTNYHIFKSEYRAGSWTHPSGLTDNISPAGQIASIPQVAMGNDGNATIVWEQSDGTNDHIFKSEYRAGSWTHPSNLADHCNPDGRDVNEPKVAMGEDGNTIIVWQQSDGTNYHIFKSEYRAGSWTHPSGLADNCSPYGQHAAEHQVAMGNDGNAIIVWRQSDGTNNHIFKSEYRAGSWTHPSGLTDHVSLDDLHSAEPQVAMDNNDNAIIVWRQLDNEMLYQIFKSEFRSGSWHHPFSSSDHVSPGGQHAMTPHVDMNGDGHTLLVWQQNNGELVQIFKSERR